MEEERKAHEEEEKTESSFLFRLFFIMAPILLLALQGCASHNINRAEEMPMTIAEKNRIIYADTVENLAESEEREYFVPGLLTNTNLELDTEGEFYIAAEYYNSNSRFEQYTARLCKAGDLSEETCGRIREIASKLRNGEYIDPIARYYRTLPHKEPQVGCPLNCASD